MKFLQKEEVSKTVTTKEYLEFEVFKKKYIYNALSVKSKKSQT